MVITRSLLVVVASLALYVAITTLSVGIGIDPMSHFDTDAPSEAAFFSFMEDHGLAMTHIDWALYLPLAAVLTGILTWLFRLGPSPLVGALAATATLLFRSRSVGEGLVVILLFTFCQWAICWLLEQRFPRDRKTA